MCGIYITNLPFKKNEVKKKLKTINFRGPDNLGVRRVNNLTLGHLRLSILDLDDRANQPMEFDGLHIVFNGEIYNFLDIKKELLDLGYSFSTTGDTEVILKGYQEWGNSVVSKMNGMFALAIYDTTNETVFCSRDRLGQKPFYYYWKNGNFEICSQLRPISENKEINEDAISMYLDCTYIPSPYSIFKDVHKLPPGCNLLIDLKNNSFEVSRYWDLTEIKTLDISYEEAQRRVHDLLKDAVKIRLQSDVPYGSFLSGGVDSALITSIASEVSSDKIKTFSIGFEDPKYDESKIAGQYAEILQTEHTETICKPEDFLELLPKLIEVYDEPFADSSALPSLLLNKTTKRYVTVALSGDGGDESFLGYNHFDWVTKFNVLLKLPFWFRYFLSHFVFSIFFKQRTEPIKRILRTKNENDFIKGIFVGYNTLLKERHLGWLEKNYSNYKSNSINNYQKTADLNIKLWLENDSNVKVDRASMAYSVELRSPFLDYRLVELARALPLKYRYQKKRKKRILRDILNEYIPENIFDQPKSGFSIPVGSWMKNELRKEFDAILVNENLALIPNLNVEKFNSMYLDHMSGMADYSSYIWRVYILIKWFKEFRFLRTSFE
ncbi:MAG: asparagine synthase (glutamine-hydrolyzing) [Flavobacteriaceae bacterium]|nr:asparagine synthase (glutamine-hydrolyzing) [Flavobacteriaceae bacterium]|tara:strand:- start:11599 stop:13422 length:1824 start_codon:yes stop_codon:yes gene_type:complete